MKTKIGSLKFNRPKNKYVIEVTRKKNETGERLPVWYYQNLRTEAMYDAYWAFVFSNATRVRILSARDRKKVFATFNSINDWKEMWVKLYGWNANYMVWYDRH